MIVVHSPSELRSWSAGRSREGLIIGFVPTMGALHVGHEKLLAEARRGSDRVVASIFVNRLQFDDPSDFDRYPVTFEEDVEVCRRLGVDVVYAPDSNSMYPEGFETSVSVGTVADLLEGRSRPGHFVGVATVVAKLLNTVRPDRLYLGQKDFQQVAVIRRLVADLDVGCEVVTVPTVRDPDGLALSSRNRRLSAAGRLAALAISRCLFDCEAAWRRGARDSDALEADMRQALESAGLVVDYAVIVDASTLVRRSNDSSTRVALVAAECEGIRLIDNVVLVP